LLPFSKRKNAGGEVELDDDDLVLVESPPPSFATSSPLPRLLGRGLGEPPVARARRISASVSRRIIDESVAQDVAGECLSAIAAASRERQSSSQVRAAVTRPPPPPSRSAAPAALAPARLEGTGRANPSPPASRLPSVSPPPFVRTTTTGEAWPSNPITHVGARESSPPPAFVRRSSPMIPIARHGAGDPGSVAPVSSERTPSPTVIVVRERPKAVWVIGAAAIGAVFAVLASRLVMTAHGPEARPAAASPPTLASAAPPVLAAAPAVVVAPVPAAPPSAPPSPSASIMRFGDDQGVAFKAPRPLAAPPGAVPVAPSPVAASTAPRPRASAVGPALPDGSLSLGATSTTPTSTSSAAAAARAPAPPEKKPRVLTPEQQLAEAQLKASMR